MNQARTIPHLEDIASVGTRVSWGAILAGAFLSLGIYFLLGTIGTATGLSASDHVASSTSQTMAIVWAFGTTAVALFVGGLVSSLFTVGENKVEAVMTGIIMWAILFCLILGFGAVGIRAGSATMVNTSDATAASNSHQSWEVGARAAGVTSEQIDDWRRRQTNASPQDEQSRKDMAKRLSWYAFGGTWLSMLAAAAGAFVGAGPTFRLVTTPVARGHV